MDKDRLRRKKVIIFEKEGYRVLDQGFYRAELMDIQERSGSHGLIWVFLFKITEGKFKDCLIEGLVNQRPVTTKGKLGRFARALSGAECRVNQELDVESLIGKECIIDVERKNKANGINDCLSLKDFEDLERDNRERKF